MSTQKKLAHILVIEDDVDIRESVVEVLEDEGHRVTAAADGAGLALTLHAEASGGPEVCVMARSASFTRTRRARPPVPPSSCATARRAASRRP